MNNIDLDKLEAVLQLVDKHKLEILEIEGLKIVKTKHDYIQTLSNNTPRTLDQELFGDTFGS